MNNYHYLFKLIIVGNTSTSHYHAQMQARVVCCYSTRRASLGQNMMPLLEWNSDLKALISETKAGQESFKSITRSYYRGSIAAILVFDITQRKSFDDILKWQEELSNFASEDISVVLIGNKKDLHERRQVSVEDIQQFSSKSGFKYYETSAMTGENVTEPFDYIADVILSRIESGDIDISDESYGIKIGQIKQQTPQQLPQLQQQQPISNQTVQIQAKQKETQQSKQCCLIN